MKRIFYFVIVILFIALNIKADELNKKDIEKRDSSEFNLKKFNEGVDFYARGNEPFWNLDFAINQFLHFNVLDGMTINLGSVKGEKAMDANVTRYFTNTDNGTFTMTISQQECSDNMSGDKFDYKVIVEINNPGDAAYKKFEGCGKYVPNYKLNRTWVLKKLGDKDVTDSDYKRGLPEISIDIEKNRFIGNSGCNSVIGFVTCEANYLRFGQVVSTMVKCSEFELVTQFTKALEKTINYKLIGNQLMLANPDEVLMVLYDPTLEVLERSQTDSTKDYRLNDIWVLEIINETKAEAKNYMKGLPVIEFHINDVSFLGNGGCNEYNGKFEVNGEAIKFGPIASTRMACPGNFENDFFTALRNVNNFNIANSRLYLMQDGKTLIVFRKVD